MHSLITLINIVSSLRNLSKFETKPTQIPNYSTSFLLPLADPTKNILTKLVIPTPSMSKTDTAHCPGAAVCTFYHYIRRSQ